LREGPARIPTHPQGQSGRGRERGPSGVLRAERRTATARWCGSQWSLLSHRTGPSEATLGTSRCKPSCRSPSRGHITAMKLDFSGAPEIAASPDEVWKCLLDHEFVASVAPGVESVQPIDDRHFKVISGFGVGAVKVTFQLDVELSDVNPPKSLKMSAHGKAPGSGVDVSTTLEIEPVAPNRCRLKWSAISE